MENRRYEQGGVVSFLVIALALGALLVGGIVLMKNQTKSAQGTNNVAVTEQEKQTDNEPAVEQERTDTEQEKETAPSTEQAPATTQNNTPSVSSSTPVPTPAAETPTAGTATRVVPTGPSYGDDTTGALPSTGIEDALAPLFALGGIGVGIYVFAESQRKLRLNALK